MLSVGDCVVSGVEFSSWVVVPADVAAVVSWVVASDGFEVVFVIPSDDAAVVVVATSGGAGVGAIVVSPLLVVPTDG